MHTSSSPARPPERRVGRESSGGSGSSGKSGDEIARSLTASRHGVVGVPELRAAGLDRNQIAYLRRSPRWEQVTAQVLRLVGSPQSARQRVMAAVLDAAPGARLGYEAGTALWGVPGCRLEPIAVCRTSSSTRRSTLTRIHQVRSLPERWVTVLDGIPVVRPELLALQLYGITHPDRAERFVDRLWSLRLLSGRSIDRLLVELGRSGRNGTTGLRLYLADRGPDYTPPSTNLESRVRQILMNDGIDVQAQVNIGSDECWTGRVDFIVEDFPLIVEVQSTTFHQALVDRLADAVRRATHEAAGFVVVEVWDDDVWTDPAAIVAAVREGMRQCRAMSR